MPLLNQRVARFTYSLEYESFVYCVARSESFKDYAISMAHGSAQPNVSTRSLLDYRTVIPNRSLISRFNSQVRVQLTKILTLEEETQTLTQLRDTLLPELISGKVRVPEGGVEKY
jgi:type I restriction enzyme S subunit